MKYGQNLTRGGLRNREKVAAARRQGCRVHGYYGIKPVAPMLAILRRNINRGRGYDLHKLGKETPEKNFAIRSLPTLNVLKR